MPRFAVFNFVKSHTIIRLVNVHLKVCMPHCTGSWAKERQRLRKKWHIWWAQQHSCCSLLNENVWHFTENYTQIGLLQSSSSDCVSESFVCWFRAVKLFDPVYHQFKWYFATKYAANVFACRQRKHFALSLPLKCKGRNVKLSFQKSATFADYMQLYYCTALVIGKFTIK